MITVVYYESPFTEPYVAEAEPGLSLAEIAGGELPEGIKAFIDDGTEPVERDAWALTYPADGAVVRFAMVPQGPVKAIAIIVAQAVAQAAVAAGVSGTIAGLGAAALVGEVAGALVVGGLAVGLQQAMNLIMAQPSSTAAQSFASGSGARFLALTSGQNSKSVYDVIPKLYGTFRIEPPLAGGYYTEVAGNDQYLHVLLCLGYGPMSIDGTFVGINPLTGTPYTELKKSTATATQKANLQIGKTPSSSFGDIDWIIGTPEQIEAGKIYSNDIDEQVLSIAMPRTTTGLGDGAGWVAETPITQVTRTSAAAADKIAIDLAFQGLYSIRSNGVMAQAGARFTIEYRKTGESTWTTVIAGWDITGYTYQPVRKSMGWSVSDPSWTGTWDVRVTRTHSYIMGQTSCQCDGTWTALRSIIKAAPWNYGSDGVANAVLLAMRVKATGKLNGTLDTVSIKAQSVLPVYNTGTHTWTMQATNNPAWAYVDALKGVQCSHPLSDSDIDLVGIANWATACAANGYEYSWYHTSQETIIQRIRAIATTGRAAWTLRDAQFGVVRDADFTPLQLISPRNSREFSFERRFPQIPHALRVRYIDGTTWQTTERIVLADGYKDAAGLDAFGNPAPSNILATKYEMIETQGVTNGDQAWKEGRYYLASLKLRPETYRVTMDIENLVLQRGDCALLAHDSLVVGLAYGRIVSIVGSVITTDELLTIESGKTYAVRIRRQDGTLVLSQVTAAVGDTHSVTMAAAPTGVNPGDLFTFGEYNYETILVKVSEIRYRTDLSAELTMIPAAPGVVTAESGTIPPWNPGIPTDTGYPPIPVILFLSASGTLSLGADGVWRQDVNVAWQIPSSPAQVDQVQIQYWTANSDVVVDMVPNDRSQYTITGIPAGETLSVQLRSRAMSGKYSDYCAVSTFVVGSVANPGGPEQASVVLTISPPQPTTADTVTLTATVSGHEPTGSVVFKDGASTLGTIALTNGVAVLTGFSLVAGTHSLTAVYGGDSGNLGATSNAISLTVSTSWAGPPSAPTSLTAVASYFHISLVWAMAFVGDYDVTEIWANTTNNRATAVKVGEIAGTAWTFTQWSGAPLIGGQAYYFWVRNRDTESPAQYSTWFPVSATAGVTATASNSPTQLLGILYQSITDNELSATLKAKITGSLDAAVAYQFDSTVDGWTVAGGTLTWQSGGTVWLSSSGTDPILRSPTGLTINGGLYPLIRMRVKRMAGSGWDGTVYYSTAGHTESGLYCKSIPDPGLVTGGDWVELTWDMHALTAGGTDWKDSTIQSFRIDLGNSSADAFLIDWIVVGRVAPGGSQLQITALGNQYTVKIDTNGWVTGYGLASTLVDGVPFSEFQFRGDRFVIGAPGTPASGSRVTVSALTRSGTTATATVPSGHGLAVGDWVGLTNVATAGWNGSYIVKTSSATSVTFTVSGSLATPAVAEAGATMVLIRKDNLPLVVTTTNQTYTYTDNTGATQTVTITPGVYINNLMVMKAAIEEAHIRNGAVTNLKIGDTIESDSWTSSGGTSGWQINKNNDVIVKGGSFQLYDAWGTPIFVSGNLTHVFGKPNLLKNSTFEGGLTGWSTWSNGGTFTFGNAITDSKDWAFGKGTAYIYQNGTTSNYGVIQQEITGITGSTAYELSAYFGMFRASGYMEIEWFNGSTSLGTASSTTAPSTKNGGPDLSNWTRLFLLATSPASANKAVVKLWKSPTQSGSNSYAFVCRAKFAVAMSPSQTYPSQWQDAYPWINGANVSTYMDSAAIGTLYVAGNAITFPQVARTSGAKTITNSGLALGQIIYPAVSDSSLRGKVSINAQVVCVVPINQATFMYRLELNKYVNGSFNSTVEAVEGWMFGRPYLWSLGIPLNAADENALGNWNQEIKYIATMYIFEYASKGALSITFSNVTMSLTTLEAKR